jgi:hypothetical protein
MIQPYASQPPMSYQILCGPIHRLWISFVMDLWPLPLSIIRFIPFLLTPPIDYVDKIITAFDKAEPKGGGMKTSAAPDSIFKVDKSCAKLAQNKAVEFHNLVAKTLYATKRARPDTCTAIALLTTRV